MRCLHSSCNVWINHGRGLCISSCYQDQARVQNVCLALTREPTKRKALRATVFRLQYKVGQGTCTCISQFSLKKWASRGSILRTACKRIAMSRWMCSWQTAAKFSVQVYVHIYIYILCIYNIHRLVQTRLLFTFPISPWACRSACGETRRVQVLLNGGAEDKACLYILEKQIQENSRLMQDTTKSPWAYQQAQPRYE